MQEKAKAFTNILIALALLVNAVLTAAGKSPLPINENDIAVTVAALAAGLDTVYVWWKNQNVTIEAQTAQKLADELKADRALAGGEGDPLGDPKGANNESGE